MDPYVVLYKESVESQLMAQAMLATDQETAITEFANHMINSDKPNALIFGTLNQSDVENLNNMVKQMVKEKSKLMD